MLRKLNKRAQTTAEYAILIALVVGAVVAMQVYVKRGLQGRIKDVVDHSGSGGQVGDKDFQYKTQQYEPYYQKSASDTTQKAAVTDKITKGGASAKESTTTTGATREQAAGWDGYTGQ
jgi:uncharacterized protein (UPF0333 family)